MIKGKYRKLKGHIVCLVFFLTLCGSYYFRLVNMTFGLIKCFRLVKTLIKCFLFRVSMILPDPQIKTGFAGFDSGLEESRKSKPANPNQPAAIGCWLLVVGFINKHY